ncbi:MAG: tRNA (adenine-N1)-methyltransferase [Brevinemataceae bacterium]
MNNNSFKEITPGELIYLCHEKIAFLVPFTPNGKLATNKGEFVFAETHKWGDIIFNHTQTEHFTILHPTLSDRIMKVKRATTISYPKDIGAVILETDIFSGAKVLEIGTGSAAFAIAVSGILGEHGKIYSFEKRPEHQEIAVKNFNKLARFQNAEFILKDDVHLTGFGITEKMDTVYVDVPDPIPLLGAVREVLKPGAPLAVIVPCVEQLADIISALPEHGFTRIRAKEILERGIRTTPGRMRPYDRMVSHTVYLLFAALGA